MLTLFAYLPTHAAEWALLAAPNAGICWAIVLISLVLGLAVTLSPARRPYEVKRRRED